MLRASAEKTDTPVDLRAVVDPAVDSGLEVGAELSRLVSALVSAEGVDAARAVLADAAGGPAAAKAAAVCGNFQMMNHVVDATGLPTPRPNRRVARALGLPDR